MACPDLISQHVMLKVESCLFLFELSPLWLCQVGVVDYLWYPGRFWHLNFPSISMILLDIIYCLDYLQKMRRVEYFIKLSSRSAKKSFLPIAHIFLVSLVYLHARFFVCFSALCGP